LRVEKAGLRTIVVLEQDEEYMIPQNCWAFDAETKTLILRSTVKASECKQLVLVPKVAGG